jgi:glycosyltransferase involved in cell wall biosynthesis
MSRFPHLPETFILREMTELERHGWQVALYPLILQEQAVVHAEAQAWIPRAQWTPFVSAEVLAANSRALVGSPLRYAGLWRQIAWENRTSPNFLARALALLPKAVTMARRMQQEDVAHIHAHYATHPALVAWLIHKLTGISYSITVHAHDIFVRTEMLATKLRDSAFVVAISEYNREYLARVVGPWARDKVHVVHCGVEPSQYQPRSALPERGGPFEIISIGSLQPYKGQLYLIEACALLREQGVPVHCRIVGGGEEREALEAMIRAARLEGVVELLGPKPQEEVARLLPAAHCYVQPSIVTPSGKMEGIPVALMEALACALPVVATSLSGVPELVRAGETGRLVPPADAKALADALAAVYADPEGAAEMARMGRTLVMEEFALQSNVARLSALFERVAHAGPQTLGSAVLVA